MLPNPIGAFRQEPCCLERPSRATPRAAARDGAKPARGADEGRAESDAELRVAAENEDALAEPEREAFQHEGEAQTAVSAAREERVNASIDRFDSLSAYMREIRLLRLEETQALAERLVATRDTEVAARLVTANLRLVVKIAYEYRRAYRNIIDLIQDALSSPIAGAARDPRRPSTCAWSRRYSRITIGHLGSSLRRRGRRAPLSRSRIAFGRPRKVRPPKTHLRRARPPARRILRTGKLRDGLRLHQVAGRAQGNRAAAHRYVVGPIHRALPQPGNASSSEPGGAQARALALMETTPTQAHALVRSGRFRTKRWRLALQVRR